ncbi:MAG: hypothetical protein ACNA8P_12075, partial [Phycisphaerales bacterium]
CIVGCDARAGALERIRSIGLEPGSAPATHSPPLLIAGLCTPWLLEAALRSTPPMADGFTPWIFIVEPDPARGARALAMLDLTEHLRDPSGPRVRLLSGPEAIPHLQDLLVSRMTCSLPHCVLTDPQADQTLIGAITTALDEVRRLQEQRIHAAQRTIDEQQPDASRAVERIRSGDALRVLMPVSRYTNFVRHSATDLGAALESLGHTVTTLTEPDPHSTLSRLAYLEAFAALQPDLILLINHPRWRLAGALPDRAASICWIQDAMGHLYEDVRSKQGPLDFFVGHRFHELIDRFGYRADRMIDCCVPVSSTKFHNGLVSPELTTRFTCDVAFATRHSETPEAMVDRLTREAGPGSIMARIIERTSEQLHELFESGEPSFMLRETQRLAADSFRAATGRDPDDRSIDEVSRLVVMPLADRIVRHRVIGWAAEICDRRRWTLALYGTGWEHHPTLGRYARGELPHGEELRAAYQCAGVHLHASAHSLIHQRVIECLFSGGRVLCYERAIDAAVIRRHVLGNLLRTTTPDSIEPDRSHCYSIDRHIELVAYLARCEQLGLVEAWMTENQIRIPADRVDPFIGSASDAHDTVQASLTDMILDRWSFKGFESLEASLCSLLSPREKEPAADCGDIRDTAWNGYSNECVVARV